MILLPDNSYRTELKVNPKNWQTSKASIKKYWFIYYRLYSSKCQETGKFKDRKLLVLKGMNHLQEWQERIYKTERIITDECFRLNHLDAKHNKEEFVDALNIYEIPPSTAFIVALTLAEKRITAAASTKRDLRSTLNFVTTAAEKLNYMTIPIKEISRRHIKNILFYIDTTNGESIHRYNKLRSYLMMIYKELVELEAVDYNPLKDISKKKGVQKLRKVLSIESRQRINEYLQIHHYRFWLFTNIFFHSGCRLTELMNVKTHHVNINKQLFVVTIKKGQLYKEVRKPIKNIAIEFWNQALKTAAPDDYLFSKGLQPGKEKIQSFQITKRWNRLIKCKLGIREDFYSLKHLNLDETASILGLEDASALASHTSSIITAKHYTINESNRQMERLKLLENKLA